MAKYTLMAKYQENYKKACNCMGILDPKIYEQIMEKTDELIEENDSAVCEIEKMGGRVLVNDRDMMAIYLTFTNDEKTVEYINDMITFRKLQIKYNLF